MGAPTLTLRSPRIIRCMIAGFDKKPEVSSITISASRGQVPRCDIELQPAVDIATGLINTEQALQTFQRVASNGGAYLESRDLSAGPDVDIEIGEPGHTIKFRGYVSDVGTSIGLGDAGYNISASGSDRILDLLDVSVYTVKELHRVLSVFGDLEVTSLKQILASSTEFFRSNNITVPGLELSDYDVLLAKQSLATNDLPWVFWDTLLAKTDAPFWDELLSKNYTFRYPSAQCLAEYILQQMLRHGKSSAFALLQSLGRAFKMEYIPNLAGPGHLVESGQLISGDPQEMVIDSDQLTTSSGSNNLARINRVICKVNMQFERRTKASGVDETVVEAHAVGGYPTTAPTYAGTVQEIAPPPWFAIPKLMPATLEFDKAFNIASVAKKVGEDDEQHKSATESARAFLDWWCEQTYLWLKGFNNSASLTGLPLDSSYEVGNRLRLTSPDGVVLCTGLVENITHHLSVRDNNAVANTSARLSHVTYE